MDRDAGPGRQVRLCGLIDRRVLPAFVFGAAASARERDILPKGLMMRKRLDTGLACAAGPRAISGNPQQEMVKAICRYIEQRLDEPMTLERLGSEFGQSPFHLQRTFKSVLGISPKAYADSCRMKQLKSNLRAGPFGNSSHV